MSFIPSEDAVASNELPLYAGIFGVFCSGCDDLVVKSGNKLHVPALRTIQLFWKSHSCCIGSNNTSINCTQIHKELIRSQQAIRMKAAADPVFAQEKINNLFPNGRCSTRIAHYCSNCGYSSPRMPEFIQHFGKKNRFGCQQSCHSCRGQIMMGPNLKCPTEMICARRDEFLNALLRLQDSSPNKRQRLNGTESQTAAANITPAQQLNTPAPENRVEANNSNNRSIQQHLSFSASPQHNSFPQQQQQPSEFQPLLSTPAAALNDATSNNLPKAVNDCHSIDAALQCFINANSLHRTVADSKKHVDQYRMLFTKIVDEMPPSSQSSARASSSYWRELGQKSDTRSVTTDNVLLPILVLAGEKWLRNAANEDVRRITAGPRGRLFQVGQVDVHDADAMVHGKTFAPSRTLDNIVTEWKSFVCFIIRFNSELIKEQLEEAHEIYNAHMLHHDKEADAKDAAAAKIVDTNIIMGIILAAVTEEAEVINGVTTINYYLASKSIVSREHNSLRLMNGGSLASNSSNFLRLIRHGICSHLCRITPAMRDHAAYNDYSDKLLNLMQTNPAIETICSTIRMGKQIEASTPTQQSKAFDPATGEVMVNNESIKKDVWSNAIPKTRDEMMKLMSTLFSCNDLLQQVLDPKNPMLLDGDDAVVKVFCPETGDLLREINVKTMIIPVLSSNYSEVQETITKLFNLEMGTLLYLSSGAGRGTEIRGLSSFQSGFKLRFNMLCFQLRSNKGVTHGVDTNDWVNHYAPETLSRLIVVLNLCIYPEVDRAEHLVKPSHEKATEGAGKMFQAIFGVSGKSTKDYREFVIQIVNYISPVGMGKSSANPTYAKQFHHSSKMHDKHYSSKAFFRDCDGNVANAELEVARTIHQALGETVRGGNQALREQPTLPVSAYHHALKRGIGNDHALCTNDQLEAFRYLDNHNTKCNAMVFLHPGAGKSFWNTILLARVLQGAKWDRLMVVMPHSALLSQQVGQSRQFFRGTDLQVTSIFGPNVPSLTPLDQFDLSYVSISAFSQLVSTEHRQLLESWNLGTIFIDEIHLMFCELFRVDTWNCLEAIQGLGTQIVCLSATTNKAARKVIASYLGLSVYENIGSTSTYETPNVAILLEYVKGNDLISKVVAKIKDRFQSMPEDYAVHVITCTKDQATTISEELVQCGIKSSWVTGDDLPDDRARKMDDWTQGRLDVLVSTMDCGFDCSKCKEVIVAGCVRSVAGAVQSIGRIRKPQQDGPKTPVTFLLEEECWDKYDKDETWEVKWEKMRESRFFGRGPGDMSLASEETSILLKNLFHKSKVREIFEGKECLLTALYRVVEVSKQKPCRMCSVCLKKKDGGHSASVKKAKITLNAQDLDEKIVNKVLETLKDKCYGCGKTECDGLSCIMTETTMQNIRGKHLQHWCKACFGKCDSRVSFHTSNDKSRNDSPLCEVVQEMKTDRGNVCPNCWMYIDQDIQHRGTLEDHRNGIGNCPYQLRIRRILLHTGHGRGDRGAYAAKVIKHCKGGRRNWYNYMAGNIRRIKSK